MGRFYIIGSVVFLAAAYFGIVIGMYFYLKRTVINGKALIDTAVNKNSRADKMGLGEFSVYGAMLIIASIFVIRIMQKGVSASSVFARYILIPPIMAFFNARKRTGKSLFALIASFALALFFIMAYALIGVPPKPPSFSIDNKTITMTQTTVADMINTGFDIYVKTKDNGGTDYNKILSSGAFKKYSADRSIYIEKGFYLYTDTIPYSYYLLVKDNIIIGSIGLFGHKTKSTVLEDCKIIQFKMDKDCISAAKANSVLCELEGVNLFSAIEREKMKKTFGKKLWDIPKRETCDKHYGIGWLSGSNNLFWNEYYTNIFIDDNYQMIEFELTGKIAH
ncbi:hypothetical protein [Treponema pedis]|uniref:hypothetical protein n=1 Tax=Treponema pedis TaxID=409322 RepID=UPI0003F4B054|nr:hypothetical protein [Treponema pedis]